jgi:hypothetical protein
MNVPFNASFSSIFQLARTLGFNRYNINSDNTMIGLCFLMGIQINMLLRSHHYLVLDALVSTLLPPSLCLPQMQTCRWLSRQIWSPSSSWMDQVSQI